MGVAEGRPYLTRDVALAHLLVPSAVHIGIWRQVQQFLIFDTLLYPLLRAFSEAEQRPGARGQI